MTQLEPRHDESSLPFRVTEAFILSVENSQNTNRSDPIRFMCEGIVASLRSWCQGPQ